MCLHDHMQSQTRQLWSVLISLLWRSAVILLFIKAAAKEEEEEEFGLVHHETEATFKLHFTSKHNKYRSIYVKLYDKKDTIQSYTYMTKLNLKKQRVSAAEEEEVTSATQPPLLSVSACFLPPQFASYCNIDLFMFIDEH